jgi:hypothetical protein
MLAPHQVSVGTQEASMLMASVPVQISVGSSKDKLQQQPSRQMRGLGPPRRRPFVQATATSTSHSPSSQRNTSNGSTTIMGTPPRPLVGAVKEHLRRYAISTKN